MALTLRPRRRRHALQAQGGLRRRTRHACGAARNCHVLLTLGRVCAFLPRTRRGDSRLETWESRRRHRLRRGMKTRQPSPGAPIAVRLATGPLVGTLLGEKRHLDRTARTRAPPSTRRTDLPEQPAQRSSGRLRTLRLELLRRRAAGGPGSEHEREKPHSGALPGAGGRWVGRPELRCRPLRGSGTPTQGSSAPADSCGTGDAAPGRSVAAAAPQRRRRDPPPSAWVSPHPHPRQPESTPDSGRRLRRVFSLRFSSRRADRTSSGSSLVCCVWDAPFPLQLRPSACASCQPQTRYRYPLL